MPIIHASVTAASEISPTVTMSDVMAERLIMIQSREVANVT
jgi:hypothetical protein